jgi:hypothetical protein
MGIPLRHERRFMSQQALHLVQLHAVLDEPRGEGMPKIMEPAIFDPGPLQRRPEGSPEMAAFQWRCDTPRYSPASRADSRRFAVSMSTSFRLYDRGQIDAFGFFSRRFSTSILGTS